MESLHALLREHGLTLVPEFTGGFVREGSQWFTGKSATVNGRTIQWAAFGDFAKNVSVKWSNVNPGQISLEEERVLNEFIAQAHTENRKAREEHWGKIRPSIQEEWDTFSTLGESPYLTRKGFNSALFGCRLEAHERGTRTIVPARDVAGTLWGYQRIFSEKLDIGDKQFRSGARKEGCFHTLGVDPRKDAPVYFVEGIATAASVLRAIGPTCSVIACFDAGNLGPVARNLREVLGPDAPFIFCADNDCWPARDGKIYYTGERKATAAAESVGNATVVLPRFAVEHHGARPTDWNDLHMLVSIDEVRAQIEAGPTEVGEDRLVTLSVKDAKGVPKKPSQALVAKALMEWYGADLIKQGRDLFLYREGYWQHQDLNAQDRIKQEIARIYGPIGTIQDVENAYKYMLVHTATAPASVDLFVPPYFAANFSNGTLHFRPNPGGQAKLEFLPHAREDYLTTQLPFEFPGLDSLTRNAEFDSMLERVFKGDPDKEAKIRTLAQMFGAVVMPCYPKIFFLIGPKGSGKSTVCKLLARLVNKRNMSHVDPSSFHGFHMDSMVGKLLNLDTDISLHKLIADEMVKKICDRFPFRISRKFQTDLIAPIAPIHVFGANDLPQSMEGATGAYERRVIIVKFGAWSAESQGEGGYDVDYDEFVWQKGWQGILAFALGGLQDLLRAKGHYAVPGSSRDALKDWDTRSDTLGQFLEMMAHGELDKGNQYKLGKDLILSRKNAWETFNAWQVEHCERNVIKGERAFCNAMRMKGFQEYRTAKERFWVGLGDKPAPESDV